MAGLNINGETVEIDADPTTPLLWVIRDYLNLTGTKFGCGMAQCGVCTVHMDGQATRSCIIPLSAAEGRNIVTIEGIGNDRVGQTVQISWIENDVPQCGYCQSGQIMSAVALLKQTPMPDEDAIRQAMNGNICRCGTYVRINKAIQIAADRLSSEK